MFYSNQTPETESETETAEKTETEVSPGTDPDDLVPEPAVENGCKAVLFGAPCMLLLFGVCALLKTEDKDA